MLVPLARNVQCRRVTAAVVAMLCVGLGDRVTRAQVALEPPHSENTDPGDDLYHTAFAALAVGDAVLARQLLEQFAREYPNHAWAERARVLAEDVAATAAATATAKVASSAKVAVKVAPAPIERAGEHREAPSAAARAELITAQTINGLSLAGELCAYGDCEDARVVVTSLALGGGAGFAAAFTLSSGGVRPGLARALTWGPLWGAYTALMLDITAGWSDTVDGTGDPTAGIVAVGQLAGFGTGFGLYELFEPRVGDVSMTVSGGLYVSATGLFLLGLVGHDYDDDVTTSGVVLASGYVGLLAGALLTSQLQMSTSRSLIVDAGALVGALSGMAIDVLVEGDHRNAQVFSGLGLLGMVGGIAGAFALTSGLDAPEPNPIDLSLLPIPGGALLSARGVF